MLASTNSRQIRMVIVYTAILGGCDSLKPAPSGAECILFTNTDQEYAQGWKFIVWDGPSWHTETPRREAWRLRCVPHSTFNTYDTVVWVDASFTMTDLPRLLRDSAGHELSVLKHHKRKTCYEEGAEVVKNGQSNAVHVTSQMARYHDEWFLPTTLSISCIVVRQNTPAVTAFNNLWDSEIQKHPGDNTQLSLDYCAWKTGVGVHHLEGTRHDNPYALHDHADHKKRRKPYR